MAASALLALSAAAGAAEVTTSPSAANRNELAPSAPGVTPTPGQGALESLVAAAATGNVDAMNDLGVLYSIGGAVPLDYSKALYWYQKAIDGGSPEAMNNLGTMYLYGVGLPRDYSNAFRWFERSAEHGNPHAHVQRRSYGRPSGWVRRAIRRSRGPCIAKQRSPASRLRWSG